jgi:hypothetical protein
MQVWVLLTVYWKFSLVFVFVKYKTLYFFLWCFACHQSLFGIQRLLAIHSSYFFFFFASPTPEQSFKKFPSITEQTVRNNYWSRCVTSSVKCLFHSLRFIGLWLSETFCFFVFCGRGKSTTTFSGPRLHSVLFHSPFTFNFLRTRV